jgi:hypothetical protein
VLFNVLVLAAVVVMVKKTAKTAAVKTAVETWLFTLCLILHFHVVMPVPVDIFIDIVGCPTVAQLQQIEATVREFMSTAEPSMPIRTLSLHSIVTSILGIGVDVSARFEPVNPSDFYGGTYGPFVKGTSKVFAGNCDIEPECDYLPCLNNLTITRPDTSGASCT